MTVDNPRVIEFVTSDPLSGAVSLVMVEHREWGDTGELLPELREKLNTYFEYVESGQLIADFPDVVGRPIAFVLKHIHELGPREREFIRIVVHQHLLPASIGWKHEQLGRDSVELN